MWWSDAHAGWGVGKKERGWHGCRRDCSFSAMALMWAEDKFRLEIGMPWAQWKKTERAWDGRMTTRKEYEEEEENTAIQTSFQALRKENMTTTKKNNQKKHADVALYSRSRNIEIKAKFSAWQYKKLNNIQSSDYSPKKASSVCPQSADYRKKEFLYWDTAFS